jgi:hypothetical protein
MAERWARLRSARAVACRIRFFAERIFGTLLPQWSVEGTR